MTLVKCKNCGIEVSDEHKFCPECGAKFEEKSMVVNNENMKVANNKLMTKVEILDYLDKAKILESRKYGLQQAIYDLEDLKEEQERKKSHIEYIETGEFGISEFIFCGWKYFLKWFFICGAIAVPISVINEGLGQITIFFGYCFKRYYDLKKNKDQCQKRIEEMKEFNKQLDENKIVIDKKIEEIKQELVEVDKLLDRLYSINIIHPKYYKNFIAVTSFYDYIDTERCNEFGGPKGIYDTFEMEVRLDNIIYKLDEIIEHLEQIKMNQFTLYKAITAGNTLAEKIVKSNQSIKENSQIMTENTEIIKYIELYS